MNAMEVEVAVTRLLGARRGAFARALADSGLPIQALVVVLASRVDDLERKVDALEDAVANG